MPQSFQPRWNSLSRTSLFALLGMAALGFTGAILWTQSSYGTGQGEILVQPVPFSHEHHAGILQIDCRYCHATAENASFAGMPSSGTCMHCHSQMWAGDATLEPVRESYRTGEPIRWRRVHNLPGFVYFDHRAHVQNGVGCSECHGRIDLMPFTFQKESLLMRWCLDCHRDPAARLRPRKFVFDIQYKPPKNQEELGAQLMREYDIRSTRVLTSCSTCHR